MLQTALILACIGILFVAWNRLNARLFQDSFSPFHLLFFSWILPLSFRSLSLSELEVPWPPRTLAIIGWVTIALVASSLIPLASIRSYPFNRRRPTFERTSALFRRTDFHILLLLLWSGTFAVYLYAEFLTNPVGVPLLATLQGITVDSQMHRWGKETKWAAITPLLFVLTPMLYLAARSSRNLLWRMILFSLAAAYPLAAFAKFSRSDVLIAGLNVAVVEYYFRRFHALRFQLPKLSLFKWTLLATAAGFFLYGTLRLRAGSEAFYARAIGFRWQSGALAEVAAQIYGYAALPFENLHRFLSSYDGSFKPGVSFFRPLLSAISQGDLADQMLSDVDFNTLSAAAGSNTFVSPLYAEFGLPGVFVVPIIYGVLVSWLYVRFRREPSYINFFLYLNFVYPWIWLYFNNAFSVLTFYINAGFIVALIVLYSLLLPRAQAGGRVALPVRSLASTPADRRST